MDKKLICLAGIILTSISPVPEQSKFIPDVHYGKGGEKSIELDILRTKQLPGNPTPFLEIA